MAEVIVIGGANVDIKGRARDTVVAGTSNIGAVTVSAGGVGRNIAENLAKLDIGVALMAAIGDDANGQLIRESCASAGVDVSMMKTADAPTGIYLAILGHDGELVTAINDMRSAEMLTVFHLEAQARRLQASELLVADCNLSVDCLDWLCRFSSIHGRNLLVEPISVQKARKLLAFARTAPVFAITPNQQQLQALTGKADVGAGTAILHELGFANVIVHCGRDGVVVSDGKSPPLRISAYPAEDVADVTGAGDAAVAGLICGILTGESLASAARLGQAAAALKLRTRQSVSQAMDRHSVLALAQTGMDH